MIPGLDVVIRTSAVEDHPYSAEQVSRRHDPADRGRVGEPNFLDDRRAKEGEGRVGEDDAEEDGDELPNLGIAQRDQDPVLARAERSPVALKILLDETLLVLSQPVRLPRLIGEIERAHDPGEDGGKALEQKHPRPAGPAV